MAAPKITDAEAKAQRETESRTAAALENITAVLDGVGGQVDDIAHEVGSVATNPKKQPSVEPSDGPGDADPAA